MIVGDIRNIDLSTSSFERMIAGNCLYVDKTRMIEHFLTTSSSVQLITRQRRIGKSLNMDTLRCFLTNQQDYRHLFKGLYIESSKVWEMAHSAPVFYFNLKGLSTDGYKSQIRNQAIKHMYALSGSKELEGYARYRFDSMMDGSNEAIESLFCLTEIAHELTGKRVYLLIDEYDRLFMDEYNSEKYDEISNFLTNLLSTALKDNPHLEKALITGVMRISYESMFSGLNNIKTFDIFSDNTYTDDYGFTEGEAASLCQFAGVSLDDARAWYNGIKVNGHAIYNTYSMMSYLNDGTRACYWGRSGTMDTITQLLNDGRRITLAKLLNREKIETRVDTRISLKQLFTGDGNEAFYSLLVQGGYLSIDKKSPASDMAFMSIPNKELEIVWKSFILSTHFPSEVHLRTLFDNTNDLATFQNDMEYFLTDRLSYHDLAGYHDDDRIPEKLYHIFLLGLLSAYDDVRFQYPLSNRESGNGRYDILIERESANYIFEFKTAESENGLEKAAQTAVKQIIAKRYGQDSGGSDKVPLVKVGIAFWRKRCKVAVM